MRSYEMVEQALNYIKEFPEFIDFVKKFNEENGFIWSEDERMIKIFDGINNPNHSPTSFALVLEVCQKIYKGKLTLEQYKETCESQKRIFH